jgi:CheY-specific phosphatase CheX
MPDAHLHASITEAVEQVLETMCFSAVLGPCDTAQAQPCLDRSAAVEYSGAVSGSVLIGCDEAGARSLTANFLGEEVVEDEQISEFVGELSNMICGAVVSMLGGTGHYTLGTPRLVPPSELATPQGIRCDFEIDGGILSVLALRSELA